MNARPRYRQEALRPLIPAWLDDLRLRPSEFRIIGHLWRRGDGEGWSYPSAPSIARTCRVNKDTVWEVLNSLEERGLLLRQKVSGKNHFKVLVPTAPPENFGSNHARPPGGKGGVCMAEKEGLVWRKRRGVAQAEKEGHEGIPGKVVHADAKNHAACGHGFGISMDVEEGLRPAVNEDQARTTVGKFTAGLPAPVDWQSRVAPIYRSREWHELTAAEQEHALASLDPVPSPFIDVAVGAAVTTHPKTNAVKATARGGLI